MRLPPIIVWIRKDLRLFDNPSLYHAAQELRPIIPVFSWAPSEEGNWSMGEAQQWWLHHSLNALTLSLQKAGLPLVILRGPTGPALKELAVSIGADTVYWNKEYEPASKIRDQKVAELLHEQGIKTIQWEAQILHDPDKVSTGSGTPYKVFTPFWRNIQANLKVPAPLGQPEINSAHTYNPPLPTLHIDELALLPKLSWADGFHDVWTPGEDAAHQNFQSFLQGSIQHYEAQRNFPFSHGTSRLSPHLHFGEISPRTMWEKITKGNPVSQVDEDQVPYLRQIIWREFAYHLIYHFPHTAENNLRDSFDQFPWSTNKEMLTRWQKGETGYPIVDAGMRELWRTGWMHNRVRMIVASFLTKHLLTHWLEGAKWFWDTLLDANLPNNTMGWQWASGSGADAQPFFRIFNPMNQGKKFDPTGQYVRKWVPELDRVPKTWIHEPWLMPVNVMHDASVRLGSDYPLPIVDHKQAREYALNAYKNISK